MVAGAAGANLSINVVLVLGFANLIADGFSMSVGNYFSTKATRDNYDKHRRTELWEIDNLPDTEREEIRQIYAKKGFSGPLLEEVVKVITSDKEIWADTMMKEELEMSKDEKPPVKKAMVTFASFIGVGLIPLLSYVAAVLFKLPHHSLYFISCLATGLGLSVVGVLKSVVTEKSRITGLLETVALGGAAAGLAYLVGDVLEKLLV